MATEQAATLQNQMDTVQLTVSSLEGRLEAVLQDLKIAQQRHRDV